MSRPFAPRLRVSTYISDWMPTGDTVIPYANYRLGGYAPSASSAIKKFTFATKTETVLSATLTAEIYANVGFASTSKVFSAMGRDASSYIAIHQYLDVSNETRTALASTLASNSFYGAGLTNSGTAGYIAGGGANGGGTSSVPYLTRIEKFVYATESSSTTVANMSINVFAINGGNNGTTAGYLVGGFYGTTDPGRLYTNMIQKLVYASDTTVSNPASLAYATYNNMMLSNHGTAGYITAGGNDSGAPTTNLRKIVYATDVTSDIAAGINSANGQPTASDMQTGIGFFLGRNNAVTEVKEFNFSTEIASVSSATITNNSYGAYADYNGT
jgi:hypothetical protein